MITTIHETLFIENIETINFCDKPVIYQLSVRNLREPFETQPTKGIKHDYNNCKKCKKQHANILRQATEQFNIFPNCCEHHKNLLNKD
ncbi:MAG: hypothetical protein IPK18_03410 [Sphingobacteriales bacterium]|jgi:hypothetical protein|nr:MAG: hypothetical protein IPK18_03410 [Sphingobacteriales bacterium]